jgi:hypothetical protein
MQASATWTNSLADGVPGIGPFAEWRLISAMKRIAAIGRGSAPQAIAALKADIPDPETAS